jgi:uncharacterized membrane protein YhaH (DUF805 family)
MNFPTAITTCFKKYVTFSGRAPRSEYWYWTLFYVIMTLPFEIASRPVEDVSNIAFAIDVAYALVAIMLILPSISVGVRRLHDIDRSGWWVLIGLIPLIGWIIFFVWSVTKGTPGDNRFGPNPLAQR